VKNYMNANNTKSQNKRNWDQDCFMCLSYHALYLQMTLSY
jgi:hypothetical protein